jgi:lipoic acid synthetase
VLISDLKGSKENLAIVIEAKPDILAHNLETVPRLYATCRQQADYPTSLKVLESSKELNSDIFTKSGIMLGLGETRQEVLEVMKDLRRVNCDFLTLGQYLRPAAENVEVKEFIVPAAFDDYRRIGEEMGFAYVLSSPFVRSSFHAEEALRHIRK